MRVSSVSLSMFVLLIAAFCSGYAAQSQAQTGAKSDILGHWVAPDCARAEEVLSFTRSFYLTSAPERLQLQRYAQAGTGADHLILLVDGARRPVMRQEDGVLRTGTYAEPPGKNANWDDLTLDAARDYTNCPTVPDIIPGPLQRLTRYLDRIDTACTVTANKDCARVLFKAADDDGDGKITRIELKRAVVSGYLLAELADGAALDGPAIEAAAVDAKTLASTLSAHFFATQDKDGNDTLDYNESVTGFQPPDDAAFKAMIKDIGQLFPGFKLAAFKL